MHKVLFNMFAYIFWAQLLATYYVILTNSILNFVCETGPVFTLHWIDTKRFANNLQLIWTN